MAVRKIRECDICGCDCDKNRSGYIKVKGVEYATDKDPYYGGSIAISSNFYICDDCVYALKELVKDRRDKLDIKAMEGYIFYTNDGIGGDTEDE